MRVVNMNESAHTNFALLGGLGVVGAGGLWHVPVSEVSSGVRGMFRRPRHVPVSEACSGVQGLFRCPWQAALG